MALFHSGVYVHGKSGLVLGASRTRRFPVGHLLAVGVHPELVLPGLKAVAPVGGKAAQTHSCFLSGIHHLSESRCRSRLHVSVAVAGQALQLGRIALRQFVVLVYDDQVALAHVRFDHLRVEGFVYAGVDRPYDFLQSLVRVIGTVGLVLLQISIYEICFVQIIPGLAYVEDNFLRGLVRSFGAVLFVCLKEFGVVIRCLGVEQGHIDVVDRVCRVFRVAVLPAVKVEIQVLLVVVLGAPESYHPGIVVVKDLRGVLPGSQILKVVREVFLLIAVRLSDGYDVRLRFGFDEHLLFLFGEKRLDGLYLRFVISRASQLCLHAAQVPRGASRYDDGRKHYGYYYLCFAFFLFFFHDPVLSETFHDIELYTGGRFRSNRRIMVTDADRIIVFTTYLSADRSLMNIKRLDYGYY